MPLRRLVAIQLSEYKRPPLAAQLGCAVRRTVITAA